MSQIVEDMKLLLVPLVLIAATLSAVSSPAVHAATSSPSTGCRVMNSTTAYDGYYFNASLEAQLGYPFAAGERIVITADSPASDVSLIAALEIRGSATTTLTSGLPATFGYTLTEDLDSSGEGIFWRFGSAVSDKVTWTVQCIPYSAPDQGQDTPDPVQHRLSLEASDAGACSPSSIIGVQGTWVVLPDEVSCKRRTERDGRTMRMLGWATSVDFPVDIAQRQVDNGWGAYETFDDQGLLTGVFIPAGGATAISSPGTLYAIWGDGPTT